MRIYPIKELKPLISLETLKEYCQVGEAEDAYNLSLLNALSEGVRRAENITGLTLTLGEYICKGYNERTLIAPFYGFTNIKSITGSFNKEGVGVYALHGHLEGKAILGYFTDDLLRADLGVAQLLKEQEDKDEAKEDATDVAKPLVFSAVSAARSKVFKPAKGGKKPPDLGYDPTQHVPPPIPPDYKPGKTKEEYDKEHTPQPDAGTPPPIPPDYKPPKTEEQYLADHPEEAPHDEEKPRTDISKLKAKLIDAGFAPLPQDIKSWLKNYVYNDFKREPWEDKYDRVLKHYRLGNIW